MSAFFKDDILESESVFINAMLPLTFNYKLLFTCTWKGANRGMAKWLAGYPTRVMHCLLEKLQA